MWPDLLVLVDELGLELDDLREPLARVALLDGRGRQRLRVRRAGAQRSCRLGPHLLGGYRV